MRKIPLFVLAAALLAGPHAAREVHAAYPGDNGRIIYSISSAGAGILDQLWEIDSTGANAAQFIPWKPPFLAFQNPRWSPDGHNVAFTYAAKPAGGGPVNDLSLAIAPADGSTFGGTHHAYNRPTWSPDASKLAYLGDGGIYVLDVAADVAKLVLANTATVTYDEPAWSPDGTKIALIAAEIPVGPYTLERDIVVMPAAGGALVNLTRPASVSDYPGRDAGGIDWSPDGTKIVFHRGFEQRPVAGPNGQPLGLPSTVMQLDVATRTISELIHLAAGTDTQYFRPAYSPDGTQIVVEKNGALTVMNSAGGGEQSLGVNGFFADWQPVTADVFVSIQPTLQHGTQLNPGDKIHYVVSASSSKSTTDFTITDTLPNNSTLIPGSVKPSVKAVAGKLVWKFTGTTPVVAQFDVQVNSAAKLPANVDAIVTNAHAAATLAAGGVAAGDRTNTLLLSDGEVSQEFIDADIEEMPDVTLPSAGATSALAARQWTSSNTRHVGDVAADGVSLLLLRARVDAPKGKFVRFDVKINTSDDSPQGGLFAVNDDAVIDDTTEGGHRDDAAAPGDGAQTLTSQVQKTADGTYAFALYRAPRNFDGSITAGEENRLVTIHAQALDAKKKNLRAENEKGLSVIRPLVIFQHGTFDSPDGWTEFPLWTQTGNELKGFVGWTARYPFETSRTSFASVFEAAGPAIQSAKAELQDMERVLESWRSVTGAAGAQADVVTHSYGGVVTRVVAQGLASVDSDPLSLQPTCFRSARNWGHGLIHKLITIACTHRGSHTGNHLGVLNTQGLVPGVIRDIAASQHAAIDTGAVEDQMVLSPLLRSLTETRIPGHAIVGSGLPEFDAFYASRFSKLWAVDRPGGPYQAVGPLYDQTGTEIWANFRKLANYTFDLDYTILSDDTSQDPNYDLTVSSYSMRGRMPRNALSDHTDLEAQSGLAANSLVGRLTHGDEIWMGAGDPTTVSAVADRVAWLLRQATTSQAFAHFPATMAAPPTALEASLSNHASFDPAWLYEKSIYTDVLKRASSKSASAASPPDLPVLTSSATGDLAPGQVIQVGISWPGKTVGSALVTWSSGIASEETLLRLGAGQSSATVNVSAHQRPGPFDVFAYVTASDGTIGEAILHQQIESSVAYVTLAVQAPTLEIRSVDPAPLNVYGRLPDGTWQNVGGSSQLTVVSADPGVVSVTSDGRLQPQGLGSSDVTASMPGVGSVHVAVTVAGVVVPVLVQPATLKLSSKSPAKFVFLSTPGFDPSHIAVGSVRIGGKTPTAVKAAHVNKDKVLDAVATILPSALDLAPGDHSIQMTATTTEGTFVVGVVNAAVK